MSTQANESHSIRPKLTSLLRRAGSPLDQPEPFAASMPPARPLAPVNPILSPAEEEAARQAAEEARAYAREEAEKSRKQFEHNQRRAGVLNLVSQARDHDGRKLFSPHDASVIWQVESLVHSIAGGSPTMLDPIFAAEPDTRRPINAAVDRAIREDGPRRLGEIAVHIPQLISEEAERALEFLEVGEREDVLAVLSAKGWPITAETITAARESLGPSEFDKARLAASDTQRPADSEP